MYTHIRQIAFLLCLLILTACASAPKQKVDLKAVYDRSAQYHGPDRNPVIIIPGVLGSRLVDDLSGQTVWGAFRAEYADPKTRDGVQLISLPLKTDPSNQFGDVQPDGVLENLELNLAGFPISIQAYSGILTTLGAGGYRDEQLGLNSIDYGTDHYTCFQFDYDWRQDLAYNAAQLKDFIDEKRRLIQAQYEEDYGIVDAEVKFDIVAHSMGGLLTRYFLRYGETPLPDDGSAPKLTWEGAQDVGRAILIAPPNAGSLDAVEQLVDGFNIGRPLLPRYAPAILGTFPSIYQLLPRSRHAPVIYDGDVTQSVQDILDPIFWQDNEWGLSSRDAQTQRILSQLLPDISDESERRAIAMNYQAQALRKAKQFQMALDIPADPPRGLDLYLVVGDATQTIETLSVERETGDIEIFKTGIGDKTVLRSSALMDERKTGDWQPTLQTPIQWNSVLFVPSEHRRITSDPVFEDNVLYWLLEEPRFKAYE